jgi:hypothetical protein
MMAAARRDIGPGSGNCRATKSLTSWSWRGQALKRSSAIVYPGYGYGDAGDAGRAWVLPNEAVWRGVRNRFRQANVSSPWLPTGRRPAALSDGYGLGARKHGPDHNSAPSAVATPSRR